MRKYLLFCVALNVFLVLGTRLVVDVVLANEFVSFSDDDSTRIVSIHVATNSENVGYEAVKAFDGRKDTFWHSQFSQAPFEYSPIPVSCWYSCGCVDQHPRRVNSRGYDPERPFELRVDLGDVFDIKGVRYWPRNDGNRNGLVGEYELYALESVRTSDEETFAENGDWICDLGVPVAQGSFVEDSDFSVGKNIEFNTPVSVRYLVFRVKSELQQQEFAAVAELEILADGIRFVAARSNQLDASVASRQFIATMAKTDAASVVACMFSNADPEETIERLCGSPFFADIVQQYNRLCVELQRTDYYEAIASQLPTSQSGILPADRDPTDVVFRRTKALWQQLNDLDDYCLESSNQTVGSLEQEVVFWRRLERAVAHLTVDLQSERFKLFVLLTMWRRALLFKRSELDFEKILFVKRNRSNYNHLCDQFYGRSAVAGGGLFTLERPFGEGMSDNLTLTLTRALDRLENSPKDLQVDDSFIALWNSLYCPEDVNILAKSRVVNESRLQGKVLENGAFIAPELSFDGKKIAFAFCECVGSTEHVETLDLSRGHTQEGRCYHLFICDVDGSNLKMISDGTWNDFDPCFLPNGRLAFISERRNGYLRCGRDCPNYTLFDMNLDGTKIRCLSRHETNEWAPSVSNNGQILWTRWDYIDRFGCIAHGAWTTSPDGRNPRAVCGNYAPRHERPDSVLDIRAIPGSSKLIATAGPHHGQSFGSIVEIDPSVPDDSFGPIIRMTPEIGFPESQDGAQVWGTPWPLAEDLFLAVADYTFDPNNGREGGEYELGDYGIYLVDSFGNRELIYRDFGIGASTPIPLIARETPPVVPALLPESEIVDEPYVKPLDFDAPRPMGVVSIQNVYNSDRPFTKDTKIAAIRVVQVFCMSVPSGRPPYETGVREVTSTDSVKLTRRVWGIAPVEEDGSACFYVPAECEIYFQALDENGVVVQSMRSGTALRPNEHLSCVGCHEARETAGMDLVNRSDRLREEQIPLALRREPSTLITEGPGTQPLNFPELIQPILDKHCVGCHNTPDSMEKGAPNLGKTPYINGFYASYWNLVSGGYAFNDYGDSLRTDRERFGARASSLYKLIDNHYGVSLSVEERRRVALWLDNNTLFFGVYEKEGCEKELRSEHAVPTLE